MKLKNLPHIEQEQTQWCWAANVDMVSHCFGRPELQQCQIAGKKFKIDNCNQSGELAEGVTTSNQGVDPGDVQQIWAANGVGATFIEGFVTFEALKVEIAQGRPVQVAWLWDADGGHVVIIMGYREDGNGQFLFINDPLNDNGESAISYSDLLTAENQGSWKFTWTDLKDLKKGALPPPPIVKPGQQQSLSFGNLTITIQVQISEE